MADYREHLRRRLVECDVPPGLHPGLIEYFAARRSTGSFLRAALENDFAQACVRADPANRYVLYNLAVFLINYCPAPAWGSSTAVDAWLAEETPVPEIFE